MITTISEDCIAICEIEQVLKELRHERRTLETKIACMELARTCILTDIRNVAGAGIVDTFRPYN